MRQSCRALALKVVNRFGGVNFLTRRLFPSCTTTMQDLADDRGGAASCLWLEHDFDAAIFLIAKRLVRRRRFLQRQAMRDDEGGVDLARFDFFQQ